jgi:peptidoglycan/LPS O-acetylase OafA/YrhL
LNPVSALPAILSLALALLISYGLRNFNQKITAASTNDANASQNLSRSDANLRNQSIDGLSGFLAFFVFLHHAVIWYFYLRSGVWQTPPSYLYTHLGQSSVVLFFMITAFLFSTKLLQSHQKADEKSLNHHLFWQRLYVSRILRLSPLYFFVITVVFLLTGIESNFQLRETMPNLLAHAGQWFGFTVFGNPDVNGVSSTFMKIAGVSWTLPYEWFFYLSLPVLALLLRALAPKHWLLMGVISLVGFYFWEPAAIYIAAFAIGVVASLIVKLPAVTKYFSGRVGALIALLCLAVVFKKLPSADNLLAITMLGLAFTIFASGNTLFGVLKSRVIQAFGEISYSIYLLHGLMLYIMFKFILGLEVASKLSVVEHWGAVLACTAVLIPVCFAAFKWIEAPAIRSAPRCSLWLEKQRRQMSSSAV